MDIRPLSAEVSVCPQIAPQDIADLQSRGFRALIINRPDGEAADQPSYGQIEAEAARLGLQTRYLPVVPGRITEDDVEAFGAALRELPSPVLACCRTGTRSACLWALSQKGQRSADAIMSATAAAGYDLSNLRARLGATGKASAGRWWSLIPFMRRAR